MMTEGSFDTSVCCIHKLQPFTDNLVEQHCLPALRASQVAFLSVSWQCKNTPYALVAVKSGLKMLSQVP
jgi:hypothetical protein